MMGPILEAVAEENTAVLLETILLTLKDEGEDAAFEYVRREVLGK